MKSIDLLVSILFLTACSVDPSVSPMTAPPIESPAPVSPAPVEVPPAAEMKPFREPIAKSPLDPLTAALEFDDVGAIDEIVKHNPAELLKRDDQGQLPIHRAKSGEMAEKLWNHKVHGLEMHTLTDGKGNLALHSWAREGRIEAVAFALANYCSKSVMGKFMNGFLKSPVNAKNSMGRTPLHLAVLFGGVETVELLLQCRDLNLEAMDVLDNTPLALAMACNRRDVVPKLLAAGAQRRRLRQTLTEKLGLVAPQAPIPGCY